MKFIDFLNEIKLYRGGAIPAGKTLIWYTEDPKFASTYCKLKGDFKFHELNADLSNLNICDIGRIENKTSMKYLCGILWKHANIKDKDIFEQAKKLMKEISISEPDHLHQLIFKEPRFIDYLKLLNIDGIKSIENKSVTYGFIKKLKE